MTKLFKFCSILTAVCLAVSTFLILQTQVRAAGMTGTAILNSYDASVTKVTATFKFEPSTMLTANDKIKIILAGGFNLSGVTNSDVSIATAKGSVKINKIIINNTDLMFTFSSVAEPDGLYTVTIANLTNPAAGNYIIKMEILNNSEAIIDSANTSILIGANPVTIVATDPALTLNLDAGTCDLGILSATAVATCSYKVSLVNSTANGFSGFIKADDLRSGASVIEPISDGAVAVNNAGYGVATDGPKSAYIDIAAKVTCPTPDSVNEVKATGLLLNKDQSFVYTSAPGSEIITVCHAVAINADTTAGVYTQSALITLAGNF
jgi:hypothetical protein